MKNIFLAFSLLLVLASFTVIVTAEDDETEQVQKAVEILFEVTNKVGENLARKHPENENLKKFKDLYEIEIKQKYIEKAAWPAFVSLTKLFKSIVKDKDLKGQFEEMVIKTLKEKSNEASTPAITKAFLLNAVETIPQLHTKED